jgi:hypothetical protein
VKRPLETRRALRQTHSTGQASSSRRSHPASSLQPYQDLRGNSGIAAYAIGRDSIVIQFKDGGTYLYDYERPGREKVQVMKKLAEASEGLNTFISQNVRDNYAAKLR